MSGAAPVRSGHEDRTAATRNALMDAAERLFAEHGLAAVSSRQIAEAAGQRNNAVVGYHFGGKTELIRALMTRRGEQTDLIRGRHLAALGSGERRADLRAWADALVRPVTAHLEALGTPSWCARFTVQVMTDPALRTLVSEEACARPYLRDILDGLGRCLTALPAEVRAERGAMARTLITSMCAERERALAEHTGPQRPSWDRAADGLTDAVVGLLSAPVTPPRT